MLRGGTVLYVSAEDLHKAIEYDLEKEKNFSYKGLSLDKVVEHIAKFVSNLWQILRNALVRANYRNIRKGIEPDMSFLNLFSEI